MLVSNQNIIIMVIRVLIFILTLLSNTLMMKYFVQSLRENGASITTIVNFAFNYFLSVNFVYPILN